MTLGNQNMIYFKPLGSLVKIYILDKETAIDA